MLPKKICNYLLQILLKFYSVHGKFVSTFKQKKIVQFYSFIKKKFKKINACINKNGLDEESLKNI